jgi:hypothetical protein
VRTFSKLRALCAYPDVIDKPSARRDDAAALGTSFHLYVQRWIEAVHAGQTYHMDAAGPLVRGWLERMQSVWTPPPGIETELALGLQDAPTPRYVPVDEVAPHIYLPAALRVRPSDWAESSETQRQELLATCGLLTAGRADLVLSDGPGRTVGAVVSVDDIKTGSFYLGDPKLLRQLLAQGIAATLRAAADGFIPGIYYARLGIFDRGDGEPIWRNSHEWDQAWAWVVESARMPAEPMPGAWCLSCWSKNDCVAYPARINTEKEAAA